MSEHIEQITYTISSPEVDFLCKSDQRLALVIHQYGDLSYTVHVDGFAFIVETIVGQMLSNKVADVIAARLYALCGGDLSPAVINDLEQHLIKGIGLSDRKASYIKGFAALIQEKPDFLDELKDKEDKEILKCLTSIRGIGTWSAKMYLIFCLNRLDVLPYEDGAFLQVYKWLYQTDNVKPQSIIQKCEPWRPYSSLVARYLYRALDNGLMKE